jgi:thymidylate synthase
MNNLDKQYTALLQDILDNGYQKGDRTGTGTISVFGRQIRHDMKEGFPLLTTKKMYFKGVITELLWFLRGDTNIKFLVDNDCHIWNGDAYKNYESKRSKWEIGRIGEIPKLSHEEFVNKIKTDDEFANKWGELGPVYGKQWREWTYLTKEQKEDVDGIDELICGADMWDGIRHYRTFDQIANLIRDLKTNPDSRRLMVNAWNVGELDSMVLPPCHYGFQVYTRELSQEERYNWYINTYNKNLTRSSNQFDMDDVLNTNNIPTRAISLMWNQRSVDTFLGLPFNIASYGLLLEIIAKAVNMVPEELIGNLGDTHLYSNHIEQAKEQIGRDMSLGERIDIMNSQTIFITKSYIGEDGKVTNEGLLKLNDLIPKRTREPYPLPTLNINTEFWPYEGGECGVGPLDAVKVFESFKDENFCRCLLEEDIQLGNYQSHPSIKAPLSN